MKYYGLFFIVIEECLPQLLVPLKELGLGTLSEGRGTLELPCVQRSCKTESTDFRYSVRTCPQEHWVKHIGPFERAISGYIGPSKGLYRLYRAF